uniref:Si:dkey-42i9.4 n=1 Tax=Eptatretus burgeri TaxID=7764 RepID=A0A8C4QWN7_EPTBU
MKAEIRSAVAFLGRFLTTSGFCPPELATFTKTMEKLLTEHYKHHWFPEQPHKGSGYRCIRINRKQPDPLVCRAACCVGLGPDSLLRLLPSELTLWVDPFEVSYRIGEDGSVCEIYQNQGLSRPPGVVQYTPSGVADFVTSPESSKDKVLAVKKERCGEKCSLFGNSLAVKS